MSTENSQGPFCFEAGFLVKQLPEEPKQWDYQLEQDAGKIAPFNFCRFKEDHKKWEAKCACIKIEGLSYPAPLGFNAGDRDLYENVHFELVYQTMSPSSDTWVDAQLVPSDELSTLKYKSRFIARPLAYPASALPQSSYSDDNSIPVPHHLIDPITDTPPAPQQPTPPSTYRRGYIFRARLKRDISQEPYGYYAPEVGKWFDEWQVRDMYYQIPEAEFETDYFPDPNMSPDNTRTTINALASALRTAMASLATYGAHPLIESEASKAFELLEASQGEASIHSEDESVEVEIWPDASEEEKKHLIDKAAKAAGLCLLMPFIMFKLKDSITGKIVNTPTNETFELSFKKIHSETPDVSIIK